MLELGPELNAAERIILAIDTSNRGRAEELSQLAKMAGASIVKMGLEVSSATSWRECSQMAYDYQLDWIADAKIDDISNTTAGAVNNLVNLPHPPLGITIHTNSGVDSMKAAQEIAGDAHITMLGVTHLTSIDDEETKATYGFFRNALVKRRLNKAIEADIGGLVCSPRELRKVVMKNPDTARMISMIPGTRSIGVDSHDQKNTETPYQAIVDGADLLVIGRQVTESEKPGQAFGLVVAEVNRGLLFKEERAAKNGQH